MIAQREFSIEPQLQVRQAPEITVVAWILKLPKSEAEVLKERERRVLTGVTSELEVRARELVLHISRGNLIQTSLMIDPTVWSMTADEFQEELFERLRVLRRLGPLEVRRVKVDKHGQPPTKLFGDREFAYVTVEVRSATTEIPSMFRGPWVLDNGVWYTRAVGWLPA